jgi:hypothetical protein
MGRRGVFLAGLAVVLATPATSSAAAPSFKLPTPNPGDPPPALPSAGSS